MDSTTTAARRKFFQTQCAPVFKEYQLMREFVLFQQQNLTNIYVVPSHASAFKWFGVIFIHDGLYRNAIFRFTLYIPHDYPCHETPKLTFETIPFHPLIHPKTGELNTTRDYPMWNPNVNHLWQIILLAKKIFTRLDKELDSEVEYTSLSATPELGEQFYSEALKMYREDPDSYQHKVAESVAAAHVKMYEPPADASDPHAIIFGPWNPDIHEDIRQKLVTGQTPTVSNNDEPSSIRAGLSWVQKGSMQMFSKSAI